MLNGKLQSYAKPWERIQSRYESTQVPHPQQALLTELLSKQQSSLVYNKTIDYFPTPDIIYRIRVKVQPLSKRRLYTVISMSPGPWEVLGGLRL